MNLTSGAKYLIDTNALLYSVDSKSVFYAQTREIFEKGIQQKISFVLAHQNIVEFIAVLTRGYGVKVRQALEDATAFASRFEIVFPLPTTLDLFFKLADKHTAIYPFDLYLAATMFDNQIDRIITGNAKDFAGLGLKEIVEIK